MARLFALASCLAFTFTLPTLAQEAPAPEPSHDYNTALFTEPAPVTTVLDFAGRFLGKGGEGEKDGFYPAMRVTTGAGWISFGPGYRHHLFSDRAIIDGSAAVSWRGYKSAQARFELTDIAGSHVAAGTQVVWQDLTQLNYFGPGPDSTIDARSEYRLKTADTVGYVSYRPRQWFSVNASAGRLDGPTISAPTGPFDRDYPDARLTFAADPAFVIERQPAFAHGRISVSADTRDHVSRPTRGGFYQAAWARYEDLDLNAFTFNQYEVEGAHFVPLHNNLVVLALHGWTVMSDTTERQTVPVYLMPSLGGNNTLRAYSDYRYHDRNMMLATAEARFALTDHIDTALFVDAGSVAPEVAALRLANTSYGLGIRLHTHNSTTVRIDGAHGREGWRVLFNLSDPLRLRRATQRAAAVPFVP